MNDPDRLTTLARHLQGRLLPAAIRLAEQRSGYPTGHGGGQPGGSRTETQALANLEREHVTDRDYRRALHLLDQLDQVVRNVLPNQRTIDHVTSQASNECPTGCCTSCWRTGTRSATKNPGGQMCRWCMDTAAALDLDTPPVMLVEKHSRGQRIVDRDIRSATNGRHGK